MKTRIIVMLCAVLLGGCSYVCHIRGVQDALICHPDLMGLSEADLIDRYGPPKNKVTVPAEGKVVETWTYNDKWFGTINLVVTDGKVTEEMYISGILSR